MLMSAQVVASCCVFTISDFFHAVLYIHKLPHTPSFELGKPVRNYNFMRNYLGYHINQVYKEYIILQSN